MSRTGKKQKRKHSREGVVGSLVVKKKAKVAIIGERARSIKGDEKKRRVLGGLVPRPLTRTDTFILDEIVDVVDRRVIELTVSPLADASEAYLSTPGTPLMYGPTWNKEHPTYLDSVCNQLSTTFLL
jgi:hypothetical protein